MRGELNGVIKYLKTKIARELSVGAKLVSHRHILSPLPENLESRKE